MTRRIGSLKHMYKEERLLDNCLSVLLVWPDSKIPQSKKRNEFEKKLKSQFVILVIGLA